MGADGWAREVARMCPVIELTRYEFEGGGFEEWARRWQALVDHEKRQTDLHGRSGFGNSLWWDNINSPKKKKFPLAAKIMAEDRGEGDHRGQLRSVLQQMNKRPSSELSVAWLETQSAVLLAKILIGWHINPRDVYFQLEGELMQWVTHEGRNQGLRVQDKKAGRMPQGCPSSAQERSLHIRYRLREKQRHLSVLWDNTRASITLKDRDQAKWSFIEARGDFTEGAAMEDSSAVLHDQTGRHHWTRMLMYMDASQEECVAAGAWLCGPSAIDPWFQLFDYYLNLMPAKDGTKDLCKRWVMHILQRQSRAHRPGGLGPEGCAAIPQKFSEFMGGDSDYDDRMESIRKKSLAALKTLDPLYGLPVDAYDRTGRVEANLSLLKDHDDPLRKLLIRAECNLTYCLACRGDDIRNRTLGGLIQLVRTPRSPAPPVPVPPRLSPPIPPGR